jgi:DNA-binding NarL/FixJ family response regulator
MNHAGNNLHGVSMANGDRSEVSVVIVDGQDVVHAGIDAWLNGADPPVKIVGNFSCPADFMSEYPTATPDVDVVIFALQYEGHGPEFDALGELCSAGHRVIVYSYLFTDEVILKSLDAGAVTYVAKSEGGKHLSAAIYEAGSNRPYVAPCMARALMNRKMWGRPQLSNRERQVLVAWFQTESKDSVGERLQIEPTTVSTHLQRVRAKYARIGRPASTKAALVARAIQDGLLSLEDL